MIPSGTDAVLRHCGGVLAAPTIGLTGSSALERMVAKVDPTDRPAPTRPVVHGSGPVPGSAGAGGSTDYYDGAWGQLVVEQGIDESAESWFRYLPVMRVYGLVVLAASLVVGYPRSDPDGWRGPVALAGIAALMVAWGVMWIRRPIWHYGVRILLVHGLLLVAVYGTLVLTAPAFALLQVLVYPQILFSLQLRWSVTGGIAIGAVTAAAIWVHAADQAAAYPGVAVSLLTPVMVIALAVWIRETIAQSMARRALIEQLTTARLAAEAAERKAGAAEERARLAREIHDTLAQGFASIVTHLQAADASLPDDAGRARRDVRAAEDVARASLAEARTLVWALRPEAIATAGLPAAIERLAATGPATPAVEVAVTGRPRRLHPEVEVTLLRAAQEALANARRHAGARHATVTLTYFDDEVSLDVTDDGRGFDPEAASRSAGMGLFGMRERAELLGGRLAVESVPGEGTAIAMTLPAVEPPATAGPAMEPPATAGPAVEPPAPAGPAVEPAVGAGGPPGHDLRGAAGADAAAPPAADETVAGAGARTTGGTGR